MKVMQLILFFQTLLTFLAIDAIWITQVASPWMRATTPHLLADNPNLYAALVFYLLYIGIFLILILQPTLEGQAGLTTVAWRSFLFGLVCYATYDLTNLSVMRGYTWTLAAADMLWGGVLTMLTGIIVYWWRG
jgi:uncharacterized membrane protein